MKRSKEIKNNRDNGNLGRSFDSPGKRKYYPSYKGVRVNWLGIPVGRKLRPAPPAGRSAPARKKRDAYLRSFPVPRGAPRTAPKNLLLVYDIPHERKKDRDWFRRQLKKLHFIMIQRSVWVGPSPLPAEFAAYAERIGLRKNFRTFRLARPYAVSVKVGP